MPKAPRDIVLWLVLQELVLGVVGAILAIWNGVPIADRFRWSLADAGLGVVATLPLLVLFPLTKLLEDWHPVQDIEQQIQRGIRPLLGQASIAELALLSLAAGLGEEILFRGFLEAVLTEPLGVVAALLVTNLVFGLAHPWSLAYVVLAGAVGIYLSLTLLWSQNLLVAMTAHALYDLVALVYWLRIVEDRPRT